MMLPSAFALLLDELMHKSGMNGNALAEAIGVKPTSISGWRHGRDFPDGDSMRRVIEALQGKISGEEVKVLLRAWMELRLGDAARLAWEEPQGTKGRDSGAGLGWMICCGGGRMRSVRMCIVCCRLRRAGGMCGRRWWHWRGVWWMRMRVVAGSGSAGRLEGGLRMVGTVCGVTLWEVT